MVCRIGRQIPREMFVGGWQVMVGDRGEQMVESVKTDGEWEEQPG